MLTIIYLQFKKCKNKNKSNNIKNYGGICTMKKGIDVSYCQGNINFDKIDKSQVEFVIVRSSFGWEEGQKDDKFDRNVEGFKKLGIPVGAYHYSYARSATDAIKEADYCLKCIGNKKLELPIFIDVEEDSVARLGRRVCTDIIKAFCERIKSKGYQSGVYTNTNWLNNYLYSEEIVGKYNVWLAQWGSAKPKYDCCIWQYDVGGMNSVSGINASIDLNYMMNDIVYDKPTSVVNKNNNNKAGDSQVNSSAVVSFDVKVTSLNGLNMRSGAGTGYDIKGAVPYNKSLHIIRKTTGGGYTWGYTEYMGVTGWIALDYTEKYTMKVRVTSSDGLNIRKGAGLNYEVVGAVQFGFVMKVYERKYADGYTWGYVSLKGGTKGWVALDYTEEV